MLWAKIRTGRASRLVSSLLAAVLVSMLVSPGVAVFAQETTSTPVAETVPIEVPVSEESATEAPAIEVPSPASSLEEGGEEAGSPVLLEVAPASEAKKVEASPEHAVPTQAEPLAEVTPPQDSVDLARVEDSVEVAPLTVAPVLVAAVGPRDDFPEPIIVGEYCDLTTIAVFWAGQNFEAGTVSATNDAENLYVTFTTTGGWTMGVTHLYVGTTPPASYAPGSFPLQTTHDPAVTSFMYTIPLGDIGAVAGDTIYIAAHAEVSNGQQSETAWAGTGQWPGLLFAHVVQECIEPADLTVIKFNDLNGNGEMDEGEPVISGIDFHAVLGEIKLTEMTDGEGKAVFVDLADGTYTISESLPEGWEATTEIPFDVGVAAGQDLTVYVGNREIEVRPEPADLTVIKFNDLNGNGEMDEGEPVISGIDFHAVLGEIKLTEMTDGEGKAVFVDLADGTYTISESLPEGWEATTEIPFDVGVAAGQDLTVYVGNREIEPPDVTKTFRLLYAGAPLGATFYATYDVDGEVGMVELTGPGPYEAATTFPYGTEITVSWYAMYGSEMVLLGSGEPEVLTEDLLNELVYGASASGFKFNDLDADGVWDGSEFGMGGWTISLYRETDEPLGSELYAVTSTAGDGSYSFSGLLPGTYYVSEEDRDGWFMTVGPGAPFVISNGSAIDGLVFGNAEDPGLPFTPPDLAIEKVASVEEADPGQLVSYTLTYRNVGEGVATDFRIVDDFDERYLAIVDSGGGEVVGGTIVWELPGPLSMADGARTIVYTARIIAEMPAGVTNVRNFVIITHPDDPNLTNNTAQDVVLVDNPALPFTPEPEEEFLPFTGGESALLGLAVLAVALLGLGLRAVSSRA